MSVQGTSFKGDNQQKSSPLLPIGLTVLGGAGGFAGGYHLGEKMTPEKLAEIDSGDAFEHVIKGATEEQQKKLMTNKEIVDGTDPETIEAATKKVIDENIYSHKEGADVPNDGTYYPKDAKTITLDEYFKHNFANETEEKYKFTSKEKFYEVYNEAEAKLKEINERITRLGRESEDAERAKAKAEEIIDDTNSTDAQKQAARDEVKKQQEIIDARTKSIEEVRKEAEEPRKTITKLAPHKRIIDAADEKGIITIENINAKVKGFFPDGATEISVDKYIEHNFADEKDTRFRFKTKAEFDQAYETANRELERIEGEKIKTSRAFEDASDKKAEAQAKLRKRNLSAEETNKLNEEIAKYDAEIAKQKQELIKLEAEAVPHQAVKNKLAIHRQIMGMANEKGIITLDAIKKYVRKNWLEGAMKLLRKLLGDKAKDVNLDSPTAREEILKQLETIKIKSFRTAGLVGVIGAAAGLAIALLLGNPQKAAQMIKQPAQTTQPT